MSIAVIYRRVSTGDQELSLEVQERKLAAYAVLHNFTVGGEFSDEAVSGGKPFNERQGGAAVLGYIQQCKSTARPVQHLIVSKIDRLARNAADLLSVVDQLQNEGVTIHFTDMGGDSFSTGGPLGRLFITMIGAFAEFELSIIRERTATAMAHKRSLGEFTGGTAPFGFDVADGKLKPNHAEQAIILQMADRKKGGATYNAIARWLNDNSIPTKKGLVGRWQTGNVKGVLESKLR